jgi:signal recognition particle subunit SRP54
MDKIMGLIPGMSQMNEAMGGVDADGEMDRIGGIIDSMTPEERRNPSKVIDQSRRRRIAAGAGVEPHQVNDLVKQYDGMADMMKQMSGMGIRERMKAVQQLTQSAAANPAGRLTRRKLGTGKRLSAKERKKLKQQRDKELRRRKREGRDKKPPNNPEAD